MEEISVLEPLEHSVLEVSLEGGDSLIVEVDMSDPLEHSGMDRAADVVSGLLLPEPLEHSVLVVPQEVGDGSVADITVLNPFAFGCWCTGRDGIRISSEGVLGRPQE